MDEFDLPDDLEDVEVIYSDGEDDGEENIGDMLDVVNLNETDEEIETEIIDLALLTFNKHNKSIFSSDLNETSELAVTGGEDDIAYLWNTNNGEVLLECTGHKDSVTEVGFNRSSQYIATADMSGMVQVWNVNEKKLVWCYEGDDMEWLLWHPIANVLFCGCHSGDIYIWQIPQGNCKVLPSPNNSSSTCGKVLPNGKQVLAGYEDGVLRLWNIKEINVEWSNSQNSTITNLDINTDGSLAIVAPSAMVIKLTDGKPIANLLPNGESEIECGLFNSELGIVATGSLSGKLCVWELGRHALRHEARIECAVTLLKWGKNGKIFIGATDGAVYVCDVKSGMLLETLTGHRTDILSISVFSDGNKILTTSDDGSAKIFAIKSS
ncbi:angio-associated migratory cell protein-like [Anoplophora glabripennis]|uniref:angio-associated migratory cell protein n=1 Tax=Anoplophora glabripennis TaxID=217634 RepID=UPI000874A18C|nr:angio-associated migratory cell protein [Anoplophora glabripennis]XP_023311144.1 angio-associated migratory cell protein-like [Anoplophora glabripennis]